MNVARNGLRKIPFGRHVKMNSQYLSTATISNIPQTPLKIMVFIDGTWLYYSLIQGRDNCPVKRKFGTRWSTAFSVDWNKLLQVIESNIATQLFVKHNYPRLNEVVRTFVFTSTRADTILESKRSRMISDFHRMNFEVHHLLTEGAKEKCVDIALAVEMLYMATVPDGFDIAVIITGDKDFIPALQKTRMKGKRVAVCSIRNSCNRDLTHSDDKIKDFDNIWLDDHLDMLIVPKVSDKGGDSLSDAALVEIIRKYLKLCPGNCISSRDLGRYLQDTSLDVGVTALSILKKRYASLRAFVEKHYQDFDMEAVDQSGAFEFKVLLAEEDEDDPDEETSAGADEDSLRPQSQPPQAVSQLNGLQRKIWPPAGSSGRFSSLSMPAIRELITRNNAVPVEELGSRSTANPTVGAACEYEEQSDESDPDDEDSTSDTTKSRASESGESSGDDEWLMKLISQMLDSAAPGAVMSSRNIGRYLKTHPAVGGGTALSRLKRDFGSLRVFLAKFEDFFEIVNLEPNARVSNEFGVRWRTSSNSNSPSGGS